MGKQKKLFLGNLDSKRDWGHARDYVAMQWLMLQQENPKDYVIASGRMETVRKFIEISAEKLGWNSKVNSPAILWEGEGVNEIGKRADTNEIVIRIDPRYFRPTEVHELLGDSTKAHNELGWSPKITLEEMISEMIEFDKEEAKKEQDPKAEAKKEEAPKADAPKAEAKKEEAPKADAPKDEKK